MVEAEEGDVVAEEVVEVREMSLDGLFLILIKTLTLFFNV